MPIGTTSRKILDASDEYILSNRLNLPLTSTYHCHNSAARPKRPRIAQSREARSVRLPVRPSPAAVALSLVLIYEFLGDRSADGSRIKRRTNRILAGCWPSSFERCIATIGGPTSNSPPGSFRCHARARPPNGYDTE